MQIFSTVPARPFIMSCWIISWGLGSHGGEGLRGSLGQQGKPWKGRSAGLPWSLNKQRAACLFVESGLSWVLFSLLSSQGSLQKGTASDWWVNATKSQRKGQNPGGPCLGAEFGWIPTIRGDPRCCLVELEHAYSFILQIHYRKHHADFSEENCEPYITDKKRPTLWWALYKVRY